MTRLPGSGAHNADGFTNMPDSSRPGAGNRAAGSRLRSLRILHVIIERRSYSNLLYLLMTFPMGLFYFIFLAVLLSVGVGTAVLGVGLILLWLAVVCWWGFAAFERYLLIWWTGVDIPPMYDTTYRYPTFQGRALAHIRNPTTWKSLAYLMVEMPFGILSFVLLLVLLTFSLGLIVYPVAYIVDTAIYNALPGGMNVYLWFNVPVNGVIEPGPMILFLLFSGCGIVVFAGSLHFFKGVAYVWGLFARMMLGMDEGPRRVAQARAVAAQERAKAERADQSRRELIVNVSHELRTPIASIRGHVESLLMPEEERPTDVNPVAYLEIVAQESERLSTLVDDLLALARADANELRLDIRPVPVGEVIEEVFQALAVLARRSRKVTLVQQVPEGLPLAYADRDRLAQVLLNLTRNAITYTPAGGIVSIQALSGIFSMGDNAAYVTIVVTDTGIGIEARDLEHIFERFYRTDASRERSTGGFGLGLSIVRDLVEAMGGTVRAESVVGEGSRFSVTLRAEPPPQTPPGPGADVE
jgi:two-component system, OmpR family, phosphate regulon sensor histidine kinase PhoR